MLSFDLKKKVVLSIGKACGILKFDDIVDQVVERDIQNGNFNEAITLLKESGKYAEIVQLRQTMVDPRAEPLNGQRVPYVIVYGSPGLPLIKLVKTPLEVLTDPSLRLNANYYISKVILPPLDRCFSLIGADPFNWYASMQRPVYSMPYHVMASSTYGNEGRFGESSIASFFKSVHCVVCEGTSQTAICQSCRCQPDVSVTALNAGIRLGEEIFRLTEGIEFDGMAEFIEVPLKRSSEVDLVRPFKALVQSRNGDSGKQENLDSAFAEFNNLRQFSTNRNVEKQQSYIDLMVKYHDQLLMLESKFQPQDITIPFKWKDAFDKGSIFGGKPSLTITSLLWERCCVLFNIGALQSQIACTQSVHTDDGLKTASKLFQQSSGIFEHLKELFTEALGQNIPTPDIQQDTLAALSALMLAQGQEAIALKGINDKMKDTTVAKLVSQTHELYSGAYKLMQKDQLRKIWDRHWLPRVSARAAFYGGVAQYYQSCVCNKEKRIGEEIARGQAAIDQLKTAQSRFTIGSATMAKLCNTI
ncbi:apoptosis-linked gene 2-interacting protein X 1-like, partial [Artemia franciscana]|uniref:apoptosis-linked gene 2-interacting protein X 1-like n=1 Tax=Artemia franciscana TaxID=6661 RepID=UPI0032DB8A40